MPDGRKVGVAEFGARDGVTVIWCHGGPGCRREPENLAGTFAESGLRVVGIDRPGYGASTPWPGRSIGDWAADALEVADQLGVDSFATVGISTGGAHALAVAAKSRRVMGVVACCAVTDMRWAEGRAMMPLPSQIWDAPDREAAHAIVAQQLGSHGEMTRLGSPIIPLADSDKRFFEESGWARSWDSFIPEMFAQGLYGYVDDRLADGRGWVSFDVRKIACPVAVLHGTHDTFIPIAQARHTQSLIPGSRLQLCDALGHFSILTEVVPTLNRLLGR
ncbi:MAG TPA: alpha/beta hydrolase [Steroidobacteraceae bacterium]|nr:alpha/beta hydrolase [Steroidobacteraceae bacterium]